MKLLNSSGLAVRFYNYHFIIIYSSLQEDSLVMHPTDSSSSIASMVDDSKYSIFACRCGRGILSSDLHSMLLTSLGEHLSVCLSLCDWLDALYPWLGPL